MLNTFQRRGSLLPPELAARMAMTVELGAPLFLFAGLATRLATLPLIGMTLVIVTLSIPLRGWKAFFGAVYW